MKVSFLATKHSIGSCGTMTVSGSVLILCITGHDLPPVITDRKGRPWHQEWVPSLLTLEYVSTILMKIPFLPFEIWRRSLWSLLVSTKQHSPSTPRQNEFTICTQVLRWTFNLLIQNGEWTIYLMTQLDLPVFLLQPLWFCWKPSTNKPREGDCLDTKLTYNWSWQCREHRRGWRTATRLQGEVGQTMKSAASRSPKQWNRIISTVSYKIEHVPSLEPSCDRFYTLTTDSKKSNNPN